MVKNKGNTVWKWDVEPLEWAVQFCCCSGFWCSYMQQFAHLEGSVFCFIHYHSLEWHEGFWHYLTLGCVPMHWTLLLSGKSVVKKQLCLHYPLKCVFFTCCWNCLQLSTVESSCSRQKEETELRRKSSGLKKCILQAQIFQIITCC